MLSTITKNSGSYALVLQMPKNRRISIGALGEHRFARGYYVYVGSAFGSGGLRARLRRHCNGGRRFWHVDHLRRHSELVQIWWTVDPQVREHDWAAIFADWLGDSPIPGFGASDSPLSSHLFFTTGRPDFAEFQHRVLHAHHRHAPLLRMRLSSAMSAAARD